MSPKNLLKIRKFITYIAAILVCLLIVFPIYWMLLSSFRGDNIGAGSILPDPESFSLVAYKNVFHMFPFTTWYKNSIIVSVSTTVFSVFIAMFSAYSMARFSFRGRAAFGLIILISQALPTILLAIPLFSLLSEMGLLNTYPGLILANVARALPFSIWLLWGFFQGIPRELEEAAQIDGLSRIRTLFRIIFPLSASGIAAVMLFAFVLGWEEYLLSLMIMTSDTMTTLTVGAARMIGGQSVLWGELMAYSAMMTIPVAIVFVSAQRYLVSGMTAGAIKS